MTARYAGRIFWNGIAGLMLAWDTYAYFVHGILLPWYMMASLLAFAVYTCLSHAIIAILEWSVAHDYVTKEGYSWAAAERHAKDIADGKYRAARIRIARR